METWFQLGLSKRYLSTLKPPFLVKMEPLKSILETKTEKQVLVARGRGLQSMGNSGLKLIVKSLFYENPILNKPFGTNDQRWMQVVLLPQTNVYQKLTPIKTMLYIVALSTLNMDFTKTFLK